MYIKALKRTQSPAHKQRSPLLIDAITALFDLLDLPKPPHPLISVVKKIDLTRPRNKLSDSFHFSFYIISYKEDAPGKIKYGQHYYGFKEDTMIFLAPGADQLHYTPNL